MDLLISVLSIVLWSSIPLWYPLTANGKIKSNSSTAIPSEAFTVEKNLTFIDTAKSKEINIETMPPIQSQDTVGSCFGCASSTIIQKYLCDSDPKIKGAGTTCNQLPRDKRISQFSLVAWADTNDNRQEKGNENTDPKDSENHKNVRLYRDRTDFSSGSNALRDSITEFKFMPESCFPFDQLVSKWGSKDGNLFKEKVYEKTRELYLNMRTKTEATSLNCEECLKQIRADFNTNQFSKETFASALQKGTFGEFLYELLFHDCKPLEISNKRPKYKQFPPGKEETADKSLVYEKIRETIDKGKPVLLSGVCLEYNADKTSCKNGHDTVASGYRKACPSDNYSSADCKLQIKIHNCWGKDWQDANNDGWVDADNLIKHLNEGKTYIDAGDLSWLE